MSTAVILDPTTSSPSAFRVIPHWINGHAIPGTSGRTDSVYNPATGQIQAEGSLANRSELNAAVEAAQSAFPDWSAQPPLR